MVTTEISQVPLSGVLQLLQSARWAPSYQAFLGMRLGSVSVSFPGPSVGSVSVSFPGPSVGSRLSPVPSELIFLFLGRLGMRLGSVCAVNTGNTIYQSPLVGSVLALLPGNP